MDSFLDERCDDSSPTEDWCGADGSFGSEGESSGSRIEIE